MNATLSHYMRLKYERKMAKLSSKAKITPFQYKQMEHWQKQHQFWTNRCIGLKG
jgi:hypothetical protein